VEERFEHGGRVCEEIVEAIEAMKKAALKWRHCIIHSRGTKSNDKTSVDWNDRANRRHCSSAFLILTSYIWSNLSKDLKPTN
jgi:hypothetical protein